VSEVGQEVIFAVAAVVGVVAAVPVALIGLVFLAVLLLIAILLVSAAGLTLMVLADGALWRLRCWWRTR
jgi:hypothetical protein